MQEDLLNVDPLVSSLWLPWECIKFQNPFSENRGNNTNNQRIRRRKTSVKSVLPSTWLLSWLWNCYWWGELNGEWWSVQGVQGVTQTQEQEPANMITTTVSGDKTLCEFYLVLKCVWTRWVQRRGCTGWSPVHWCRLFSSLTFQYLVRAGRGPGVPHRGHRASHHPPPTTSRPAPQHLSYSTVQLNNIPRIYFQDKSIHSHPLKQAGLTPGRYQVWRPRYWCHRSSGIFYNQAQLTKLSL